jgi:hypothetical protein
MNRWYPQNSRGGASGIVEEKEKREEKRDLQET